MAAVEYNDTTVTFDGNIFEDEIIGIRAYLQQKKESVITFDLSSCNDLHTAVIQLLLAFKKQCSASFVYPNEEKVFVKALAGFER